MFMPNQVHEAARQIIDDAFEITHALAQAGRYDLVKNVIKIQKKATCIIQMERPDVSPMAGYRAELMKGIATLGSMFDLTRRELREDISDDELLTVIRVAEVVVKRGNSYMDKVVQAEIERDLKLKDSATGDDHDECA